MGDSAPRSGRLRQAALTAAQECSRLCGACLPSAVLGDGQKFDIVSAAGDAALARRFKLALAEADLAVQRLKFAASDDRHSGDDMLIAESQELLPIFFRLFAASKTAVALATERQLTRYEHGRSLHGSRHPIDDLRGITHAAAIALNNLSLETLVATREASFQQILRVLSRLELARKCASNMMTLDLPNTLADIKGLRRQAIALSKSVQHMCVISKHDPGGEIAGAITSCADLVENVVGSATNIGLAMSIMEPAGRSCRQTVADALQLLCDEVCGCVRACLVVAWRPCDSSLNELLVDAAVQVATAMALLLHTCETAIQAYQKSASISSALESLRGSFCGSFPEQASDKFRDASVRVLQALADMRALGNLASAIDAATKLSQACPNLIRSAGAECNALNSAEGRALVFGSLEKAASALVKLTTSIADAKNVKIIHERTDCASVAIMKLQETLEQARALEIKHNQANAALRAAFDRVMASTQRLVTAASFKSDQRNAQTPTQT